MTIRLYDSKSQALTEFVPIREGAVGMYVCGATVQGSPHIGHLRSALVYDQWRRWFTYRGFAVTMVRNVTDIDDKILGASADSGEQWWALAYRYELEFTAQYEVLGIRPPTYEPRATASVQEMQDLIATLIERGHAYPADDDSGDVYFDTGSWPSYGELTHQDPADMAPATDADPRGKRHPADFALWKATKSGEPESASWRSPWGAGRPGWHIECSAMSDRYLGNHFDIHGGGLDLRFPHHENELAQSTAAGKAFANYWVHNGLLNVDGQKMSKSLGNSLFAADFLERAAPLVVRYFLGSAHYRSTLDYHDGSLDEARAALDRIEVFLLRADRRLVGSQFDTAGDTAGDTSGGQDVPDDFAAAMDDDLSIPQALAVLHDSIRGGNAALDAGDLSTVAARRAQVWAMAEVLGINPISREWRSGAGSRSSSALDELVQARLRQRESARAARDFSVADQIRDELAAVGIRIEDTPAGPDWSFE